MIEVMCRITNLGVFNVADPNFQFVRLVDVADVAGREERSW